MASRSSTFNACDAAKADQYWLFSVYSRHALIPQHVFSPKTPIYTLNFFI